jgi:large conductance mechanosensitive channel
VLKEFKDFALKGNVVDLAVGVIIGAAFGTIVSSMVDDVIMPVIGLLLAGIDFSALKIVLQQAVAATGVEGAADFVAAKPEVAINYGKFINAAIKFIIVAFVLFQIIKVMNSLKKAEAAAPPPPPPAQEVLLAEIRDLLKK